jgi:hypothetical protein
MKSKVLGIVLICLSIVTLAACQTNTRIPNTFEMKPESGWSDQQRQVALKSYLYAQMESNTYGQRGDGYGSDGMDFVLPSIYSVKHFPNDDIGLAYSIYEKHEDSKLTEVVLAFRGTEGFGNWGDFWHGNLLARQNSRALSKYKKLRSALNNDDHANVPITLVGHSLGGALAIHVAMNSEEVIPYYVFNSSPRFKLIEKWEGDRDPEQLFKIRYSIVETSEFLYSLRFPATEATQTYQPMNCDAHFKPFSSHGIEKLAKCLTQVAAMNDQNAKIEQQPKN